MPSRVNTRDITQAPGYEIDKNGHVFHLGKILYPEIRNAPYGPRLTVEICQSWVPLHVIMSDVWYDGGVVLCRTGSTMLFLAHICFALTKCPRLSSGEMPTPDQIRCVWHHYQQNNVRVSDLADATGLQWQTEDFLGLIKAILAASIRM